MSEELKRCPFCGGVAERTDIEDGNNAGGSCVVCTRCDASSNVEFEFKENFISNWNRRTSHTLSPEQEAKIEALKFDNYRISGRLAGSIDIGKIIDQAVAIVTGSGE